MSAPFTVPYTAFGPRVASIKSELLRAVEEVLDSGRYILGPHVQAFEEEFAAYCGAELAIGLSNGTDALHLAFRALGLGPGDEAVTVSNSFIATAAAIALTGARPVFVDIGSDLNMDPERLEAAITPRTRVIVPVHLTGRPARMTEICAIAARHGLAVIEDAAQSVGASLGGRPVGSWGRAATFSLHPLKNLHAFGDAGMVTTSDGALRDSLARMRNHGLVNRDTCLEWGYNCRLDELHAAILRIELRHLDGWTRGRRERAFRYNELLRAHVEVPDEQPGEHHVYQTYVVQAHRRDELQHHLRSRGIEALVHYPKAIHAQPAAADLGYTDADLPMTSRACGRILSLPLYPELTDGQQDLVAEAIAEFYGR